MIHVVAGIIEKKGKFLIAKRKVNSHLQGKWEFPGGKIEQGETPKQALKRELNEEFKINVEIGDFICNTIFNYGNIKVNLLVYKVLKYEHEIRTIVHEKICWVDFKSINKYDLAEADKIIVKKLLKLV